MVVGTSRLSSVNIRRQPVSRQKRKFTRADPDQTRILLENYEAEARPNARQLADMSQETNLPVEWIKKWFLRKRKADGKNKALIPAEPTFAEDDPPIHDFQALGHAHSKFSNLDAFAAADLTSFFPSVGHIPRRNPPPGNPDEDTAGSLDNEEERVMLSPEESFATGYGYVVPSDSGLTRKDVDNALTTYDLWEALLGADAFAEHSSPFTGEDTLGFPSEHPNATPTVDDPLLPLAAPSQERVEYPADPYDDEASPVSEGVTELEFALTNYPVTSMSSLDVIDEFILGSRDLDLISTAHESASKDVGFGAFDSATGYAESDLGSLLGFSDPSNNMTSILGKPSVVYENIVLQKIKEEPKEDSIDLTDCSGLVGVDVLLEAGADHLSFTLAGFESREYVVAMTAGHERESGSALGLALVNLDDDMYDPTASVADFGGFDIWESEECIKEMLGDAHSKEGCWTGGLDAMFA